EAAVFVGVVDPLLERLARRDGAGRVVGEAEVDEVGRLRRKLGNEPVLGRRGQVGQPLVPPVGGGPAGVAGHDVRVHVNGIDRVGDGDGVAFAQDVQDVAAVSLAAVGDEHFVGGDVAAARRVVVPTDRVAQPVIPLAGAVAVEALARGHVIHSAVHRLDDGRRERLGDVADAHADDAGV